MPISRNRAVTCLASNVILMTALGHAAHAAYVPIFGGPEYDAATSSGYQRFGAPYPFQRNIVNNSGTAVVTFFKKVPGSPQGERPVTWGHAGTPSMDMAPPASYGTEFTRRWGYAINDAGISVGAAYNETYGERPVRWDATGVATELGILGTRSNGTFTYGQAYAINNAGDVAGYTVRWKGAFFTDRAVRWAAAGTAATELDDLSPGSWTLPRSRAHAINESGTVVGYALKLADGVSDRGTRAVRWNGAGTAITELGNLGTSANGTTNAEAYDVNESGAAVGFATKYVGGSSRGNQAVRWDAAGTAIELGTLMENPPLSRAFAINDAGTAVGITPNANGYRAVRWDAGGSAATELGDFGPWSNGVAYDINNSETIVGNLSKSINGGSVSRATAWRENKVAIDLNNLIDPASGWKLSIAHSISDTNWIVGEGSFDPDGSSPLAAYIRYFTLQLPDAMPGDYNADYVVNSADYTYWRDHLGQNISLTGESPTAATPGIVDDEDYDFWKLDFGSSLATSGGAAISAVPEPAPLPIFALFASLATRFRRQRGFATSAAGS